MDKLLITNARLINEGKIRDADVLIAGDRIEKIASSIAAAENVEVIDARGCYLIPGMIDDQVHFREPGLTAKGDLATETTTSEALADKYRIAENRCTSNYGFYLGGTNTNIEEIKKLRVGEACGIKLFMGASTGDMLVDDPTTLELVFQHAPVMVATHCEYSPTIWENEARAREKYGDDVPLSEHPGIRSAEACLASSAMAIDLASRHDALLHILHLTTAIEMDQFSPAHRSAKRITAEVCVHHLWFDESNYEEFGMRIKCNPAIKKATDRQALIKALNEGRLDIIATDHAPHTASEKDNPYFKAPAGLPLVQHALLSLFDLAASKQISLELLVDKTCHAPADLFGVQDRGYVREGWFADLVIVDPNRPHKVEPSNVLYKCGWSPFEGHEFSSTIDTTIVNGQIVYRGGGLTNILAGQRLEFTRSR